MSYKSIMTVLTDTKTGETQLRHAIAMAREQDAHLDVMCFGLNRTQTSTYYGSVNALMLQETMEAAQAEAEEIEDFARTILARDDIRWAAESAVTYLSDLGKHVARHARFSDLVILPRPYGSAKGIEMEPVVEAALFEGHAPVLVVPDTAAPVVTPKTILIGWNESSEALSAVRAALPFLKQAGRARIVVIDPPVHGPDRSDPGGLLSQMLSRHGIKCEVDVLSKSLPRVSDVLARHIVDTEADMLVMGAYGHSRFREAILGGATRYMLEKAAIPVFMAH